MIMVDPLNTHSDYTLHEAGLSSRMRSTSHLTSTDSREDLLAFARVIGLPLGWLHGDHFDVAPSYRAKAIMHGAVTVTAERLVCQRYARRARFIKRDRAHECICGECSE
mgnify:CR=1 FL=1